MDIVIILLLAAVLAVQVVLLVRKTPEPDLRPLEEAVRQEMQLQLSGLRQDLPATVQALGEGNLRAVEQLGQLLQNNQQSAAEVQSRQMTALEKTLLAQTEQLRKSTLEQIAQMEKSISGQQSALQESVNTQMGQLQAALTAQMSRFREDTTAQIRQLEEKNTQQQSGLRDSVNAQIGLLQDSVSTQMKQIEQRMGTLETTNEAKLNAMRTSLSEGMTALRSENNRKLDEIRGTVDEKLQTTLEKRIAESFQTVSQQLEQVYKGLGEMQNLASDVGGLKKVLSGVKTRGILGEIQLGAILEEILSPEQYETNVATIPGSRERVEFAVRLPGQNGTVYLPIDSKFPGDRYAQLVEAQESGDRAAVEAAYKNLETVIRSEAKDIRTKYVEVPHTTAFGIMFLPFEGLYAEVVNRGLVEQLQREYQINVAGPSTMAALLNSLQMGFRTLAIQKRSNEVWEVLGAVKTEFEKFENGLSKMQNHLTLTTKDLDALMGTRTRAIQRKLRSVQQLDETEAQRVLELE